MNCSYLVPILITLSFILTSCSSTTVATIDVTNSNLGLPSPGQIYLYGETHGIKKIIEREYESWYKHYHNDNFRHLFIETSYCEAGFLNIWMKADTDDILLETRRNASGTAGDVPETLEFYRRIKTECPETIFHGTDVGHQYATTGTNFLKYLEREGLQDSEQYRLAQQAIEQGRRFYANQDSVYRENTMVENFIREFDKLNGESIMGIYGAAHTGLNSLANNGRLPNMATQLSNRYGNAIHSEDLTWLAKEIDPTRIDTIVINGKEYSASYFGSKNFNMNDIVSRKFWRLENAYDDFKNNQQYLSVLPYNNYPMTINAGQVFVIDLLKINGSVERKYFIATGHVWNGRPSTQEIKP